MIFKDLRNLEITEKGIAQLETLTLYLFEAAKVPEEQIEEVMENITPKKRKGGIITRIARKDAKTEVAQRMLKEGLNLDLIVKISDLPLEKVQELKDEMAL